MDNLRDLEGMHTALAEFRKIGKANREVLLGILSREHVALGDKVDDPYHEIRKDYLAAGGRPGVLHIPAIKRVREIGGLGLKEAKDLVESWG